MWLFVQSTASPSAPEGEASISASNWRFQTIAQSLTWKTKPMPAQRWLRAYRMKPWMQRLFGQICEPSTADHGVASWISSLRESRASHTPSQERNEVLTTLATCGLTPSASSSKPTPNGSCWKTSPTSLTLDSTRSPETYKKWVSRLRQTASRRKKSVVRTGASGSSRWPTAVVADARSSGRHTTTTNVMHAGTTLTDATRNWPTPTSEPFRSRGGERKDEMGLDRLAKRWPTPASRDYRTPNSATHLTVSSGAKHLDQLSNFVAHMWPTPRGTESEMRTHKRTPAQLERGHGRYLPVEAENWPTPSAGEGRRGSFVDDTKRAKEGRGRQLTDTAINWPTPRSEDGECCGNHPGRKDSLTGVSKMWPTPRSAEWKDSGPVGSKSFQHRLKRHYLDATAMQFCHTFPQRQTTSSDGNASSALGPNLLQHSSIPSSVKRLNAKFVEWLMNWPIGWSVPVPCDSLEMESFLFKQRMRLFDLLSSTPTVCVPKHAQKAIEPETLRLF